MKKYTATFLTERYKQLERLQKQIGTESKLVVVNKALDLLEYLLKNDLIK